MNTSLTESATAAVYVRQSRYAPEGIDRGLARCRDLVAARGWTLAGEFADDDVSASKARGTDTAWHRLLGEIRAGRVDVVVGVDVDRLVRGIQDLGTLIELGVRVLTVDGEIDLTSADGEFRATMLAAIARFEVRRKSERRARADEWRASQGIPHRAHRVFGWESDGITLREDEAAILRDMHARILRGESIRSVARWLNDSGIETPRGKRWEHGTVRAALKRERNAGILIRHGVPQPVSQIQPVVDMPTHEAVLGILGHAGTGAGRRSERWWLAGVMLCHCGSPMGSKTIRGRGKKTPSYVCRVALETPTPGHATIAAHIAEPAVRDEIRRALLERDTDVPEAAEVIRLRGQLSDIEAERVGVQELWLLPGADKAHLAAKLANLGKRHDALSADLERALAERAGDAAVTQIADLLSAEVGFARAIHPSRTIDAESVQALANARDRWNAAFDALDVDAKRRLARAKVSVTCRMAGNGVGYGAKRLVIEAI